jgi:hypothetical protein
VTYFSVSNIEPLCSTVTELVSLNVLTSLLQI